MSLCVLCEKNKTGIFSKKIYEGRVCNDCLHMLSKDTDFKSETKEHLIAVMDKNREKRNIFSPSSSFGTLHLDPVHRMFAISDLKKDNLKNYGDIYNISELKSVGLYCKNVKNIGTRKNEIVCDIEFSFTTKDVSKKFIIKKHKRCDFKIEGDAIRWYEPGDFLVFREGFDDMLKNEYIDILKGMHEAKNKNKEWARGILFLDKDEKLSDEIIHKRRNMLIKTFHPDNGGDKDIADMINRSYDILMD